MIIFLKVAHTLFERHLFMHGNTSNQNQATTETGTILFTSIFCTYTTDVVDEPRIERQTGKLQNSANT